MDKKKVLLSAIAVLLAGLVVVVGLILKRTIEQRVKAQVAMGFERAAQQLSSHDNASATDNDTETIADYKLPDNEEIRPTELQPEPIDIDVQRDEPQRTEAEIADAPVDAQSYNEASGSVAFAGSHSLSGLVDNEYPIRAHIVISPQGRVTGRYAYETTLRKYGDKSSSWIKIKGVLNGSEISLSQDCPGVNEPWPDIEGRFSYNGGDLSFKGEWYHDKHHTISLR